MIFIRNDQNTTCGIILDCIYTIDTKLRIKQDVWKLVFLKVVATTLSRHRKQYPLKDNSRVIKIALKTVVVKLRLIVKLV